MEGTDDAKNFADHDELGGLTVMRCSSYKHVSAKWRSVRVLDFDTMVYMEESSKTAATGHELRGVVLAFLGATCWGFSATCVSWLTTHAGADVLWVANLRMLCTGVVFTLIALVKCRPQIVHLLHDRKLIMQLFAHAVVGVLIVQISYMYAIAYTNPPTALLLQETGVPIVMLIECIRTRRLPTGFEVLALALAVFGIVAIATQGSFTTLEVNPLGLAWGLCSGAALAGYNIIPVRLLRECGSLTTNGLAMLIASCVITPFVQPWSNPVPLDGMGLFALFGVVVIGTMVAYGVYLRGVADAGPVKASLVGVFEPVSGAVFSVIWLGTMLSMWDFAGGAAIIAMMIIVALVK